MKAVPSLSLLTALTLEGPFLAPETHTQILESFSGPLGASDPGVPAALPRRLALEASSYRGRAGPPLRTNLHKWQPEPPLSPVPFQPPALAPGHSHSFIMPMSTQRLSRQAWQWRRLSLVMRQSPLKGQVNSAFRFMLRLPREHTPSTGSPAFHSSALDAGEWPAGAAALGTCPSGPQISIAPTEDWGSA